MRLGLKHISDEDKLKIMTDVFSGALPGFLNNVNLSTKDGKQKYIDAIISGKNPFKKDEDLKGVTDDEKNININTITSWTDIVRQADSSSVVPVKAENSSIKNPFDNALLNVAYSKKLEEIQMETALSKDEISVKLLEEYSRNTAVQKNILSAVKFFHNMDSSLFTDCDECGGENFPLWTNCQHCGYSNDGVPVKRTK
jgi:hypothetical protein